MDPLLAFAAPLLIGHLIGIVIVRVICGRWVGPYADLARFVADLGALLDRSFQAAMTRLVGPAGYSRQLAAAEMAQREAVEADADTRAALDALTPLDVAVLTGLGWEPPAEIQRRTERALEAALRPPRVPRPPRQPMSADQRALAAEADRRLERSTPSARQRDLAEEADARIAMGRVWPLETPDEYREQARRREIDTRTFGGYGHHAEAERKIARELEIARKEADEWRERLRKERAAVAKLEAELKLTTHGLRREPMVAYVLESADGWSREVHDPRCHCGAC